MRGHVLAYDERSAVLGARPGENLLVIPEDVHLQVRAVTADPRRLAPAVDRDVAPLVAAAARFTTSRDDAAQVALQLASSRVGSSIMSIVVCEDEAESLQRRLTTDLAVFSANRGLSLVGPLRFDWRHHPCPQRHDDWASANAHAEALPGSDGPHALTLAATCPVRPLLEYAS